MHILDELKVLFWPPTWFHGGNTVEMVSEGVNYKYPMGFAEQEFQSLESTVTNPSGHRQR